MGLATAAFVPPLQDTVDGAGCKAMGPRKVGEGQALPIQFIADFLWRLQNTFGHPGLQGVKIVTGENHSLKKRNQQYGDVKNGTG